MDPIHRKVLQTNRTDIIGNIANPLELVDLLFSRGIFTESMKQEVEAEKTQNGQNRKILDTIPRRGPRAYNVFYECLMDSMNDTVAQILREKYTGTNPNGLENGTSGSVMPPQPDDLPEEWPNEAIMTADIFVNPCNVRSELVTHNWLSRNVYSMKKRCRGRCFIISNNTFYGPLQEDKKGIKRCLLAPRHGTDKDVSDLKKMFEQLHFDVVTKGDLTVREMHEELKKESMHSDHKLSECFVCIICSHGTKTGIYGVDGGTISLEYVTRYFDGTNCPALGDKPKLFFIQACQGEAADRPGSDMLDANVNNITQLLRETHIGTTKTDGVPFNGDDELDASKENPRAINPTKVDILVACATHPGYVSLRNEHYGSWFLQAVVYVFQKFACKEDIYGLLTLVNQLVARGRTQLNRAGPRDVMQASLFESSLTKKFLFFPGVIANTE
ncbi:Caspase 9 [Mactra antiquata]